MADTVLAAYWRQHVDAFEACGGSQLQYCREQGIGPRELRKWRTRFYGPMQAPRPAREDGDPGGSSEIAYAPEARQGVVVSPAGPAHPVLRRRWTDEEKRQLLWDGLNSGQPLSQFAKRRQIHPSVMHRWLCTFAQPVLAAPDPSATFAEVRVAEAPQPLIAPVSPITSLGSTIEIELSGGRRMRVGPEVDTEALRRVLAVLEPSA